MSDKRVITHPYTNVLHQQPYRICKKTVMDTSDVDIKFNEQGICEYYFLNENYRKKFGHNTGSNKIHLSQIINDLKNDSKKQEYDCLLGLSGGLDSSYLLHYAVKELGLRVLPLHIDTGWNSEVAVQNIDKMISKLKLDLYTEVLDWDDIKDLQRSFFKAGVPNLDIPQDHAFSAVIFHYAKKFKIKYILNGNNFQSESILPNSWGYDSHDFTHINDIHSKYGQLKKLSRYPKYSLLDKYLWNPLIHRFKIIEPLQYLDYSKESALKLLEEQYDYTTYGHKHNESVFTKFFQNYYLIEKFGFDKRKAHLSSLISNGEISRGQAIKELNKPIYSPLELENEITFFCKKLDLNREEFDSIMSDRPRSHFDYKTSYALRKFLTKLGQMTLKLFR